MTKTRKSPATLYEPGWVSKQQAIEILEKSDATLERLVTTNRVISKKVPREGKVPERIFSEQSLLELKAQLNRPASTNGSGQPQQENGNSSGSTAVARPKVDVMAIMQEFVQRGLRAQAEVQRLQVDAQQEERRSRELQSKLWLSLEEAVTYTGLSATTLLSAAAEQRVLAARIGRHGSLVFRRSGLDSYTPAPEEQYGAHAK